MKVLSTEKSKLLAEQHGWSLAFAQGCVEGETSRRLGQAPTRHAFVGIDEYSLGFRAGFFDRIREQAQISRVEPMIAQHGQARAS